MIQSKVDAYDVRDKRGRVSGYGLDIRRIHTLDRERLAKAIQNEVESTQSVIERPYPIELRLTRKQYNILSDKPLDTPPSEDDFLFFHTLENVMELSIDETR